MKIINLNLKMNCLLKIQMKANWKAEVIKALPQKNKIILSITYPDNSKLIASNYIEI